MPCKKMNKEDSSVAELLLQLEELKRKKAQKLLKLQKLRRRSGKLSLSGSRLENNSETPSSKQHLQENKAIGDQDTRKKCPKCDSRLKKDQHCSYCNSSKSATDKAKCTPLHPSNSENHSKAKSTMRVQANFKLIKSSEDSEPFLNSNDKTVHDNNADIVSVSLTSTCSDLNRSINLQKNEDISKGSLKEKEVFSFIGQKKTFTQLNSEIISKFSESLKLQTHTCPEKDVYDIKSIDPKMDHTFCKKEAYNSDEKKVGLGIDACYETNMHQGFPDSSSKQRKRSSSISEKEDLYEGEAKKMRISDDFKVVAEEKNILVVESSVFEDHCNENVTHSKNSLDVNLINVSTKKPFMKGSESKSDDITSNISGLLSGSFSFSEETLNLPGDCKNAKIKKVETLAEAPNKDSFESLEKNCISSPSLRLSSPFSDELIFPVAFESATDKTKNKIFPHESIDGDASCDVFDSKPEDNDCVATPSFETTSSKEIKLNDDVSDRMKEHPSESLKDIRQVPDATLHSEVLEFTEDLIAEVHSEHNPEDVGENLSPTLLDANVDHSNEKCEKSDPEPSCEQATHLDELQNEVDCDGQTADLEFDSTSLFEAEAGEDTIPETISFGLRQNESFLFKVPDAPKDLGETINTELGVADSEPFTIPETEMLASLEEPINLDRTSVVSGSSPPSHLQISKSNQVGSQDTKNVTESCVTNDTKHFDPFEDNDFLDDSFSESLAKIEQYENFQDTLMVEDTLELGNYKNIPFLNDEYSADKCHEENEIEDDSSDNIKFTYCVHSEVQESVSDVKIALFNGCYYTFVKFSKCILVCRLEGRHWNKIFFHEVEEGFKLNKTCFTKNDTFLVLVMLLESDQGNCLQFVLFEKDTKIIKLMEQTHWLQNSSSGDTVLLCGLDSLKFSTALGGDFFEVFVHTFSCLDSSPLLLSASLGDSAEGLHSLCPIESLPNAMIGLSGTMLYVWHLLETRLVTSVCLQPEDVLPIERCFWAIIENGLIYFLTLCGDLSSSYACKLFVANLATGFCQLASPYNVLPAIEAKILRKWNLSAAYCKPFLVAAFGSGSFLWSIDDEYCSASLDNDINASAIAITGVKENNYLIAIGTNEGTVNFYNLKCL